MMADAGLRGIEHNYPGEISSGVRRRVEIVRALMNDPKVLLLDEPYRALDSLTKSVMHEALLEIYYKNRVTIFFITHDLEEAIFLGHRVVDHDDAAVPAEEDPRRRYPASARLQRAHHQALSRIHGRDRRSGARRGDQGVRGRREGALTMNSIGATAMRAAAFITGEDFWRGIVAIVVISAVLGGRIALGSVVRLRVPLDLARFRRRRPWCRRC